MHTRLRHIIFCIAGLGFFLPLALAQEKANNKGNFRMHPNAQMGVYGNIENNGRMNDNAGMVLLKGSNLQTISGSNAIQFERVQLNNYNSLKLENTVAITEKFIFQVGLVYTPRNTPNIALRFMSNARHDSTSASRHVDGYVAKSGKDSFYFPIGDGKRWCPAAISTPSVSSDFFAAYFKYDPF